MLAQVLAQKYASNFLCVKRLCRILLICLYKLLHKLQTYANQVKELRKYIYPTNFIASSAASATRSAPGCLKWPFLEGQLVVLVEAFRKRAKK